MTGYKKVPAELIEHLLFEPYQAAGSSSPDITVSTSYQGVPLQKEIWKEVSIAQHLQGAQLGVKHM